MPLPKRVLMVEPEYFDVEYVINPHMEGHIGGIDKQEARRQWEAMRDTLQGLGLEVHVIDGQPGLPDMVFCANQSLPCLRGDGSSEVVMSIMHANQRKGEVPFVENFYRSINYTIHHLNSNDISDFEGMGDALWHAGRRLIWGGYGYRSSLEAYESVSDLLNVPVIALKLVDPAFYHLDTCLCILNEKSALYYPAAFTQEGVQLLQAFFPNLIEVSSDEAVHGFACNALCPDGKNVLIHKGLPETNEALVGLGFHLHEIDTSEFLKSGGSVFCMKMMLW
jgi:N-dimethylarginine dimethylaminohydrolase